MLQLIEQVQEVIKNASLDLGSCCATEGYSGHYEDVTPCTQDAVVALFDAEFDGLVLCERHYLRLQRKGQF